MTKLIPTDVYDSEGSLLRLDFFNLEGGFEFQAIWDEHDEQTSENREKFRTWAYHMAKQLGYDLEL